jgi:hypothetical protein
MRSFAMKKGATRAVAPFIVVLPKPNQASLSYP